MLLLLCCGGAAIVGALAGDPQQTRQTASDAGTSRAAAADTATQVEVTTPATSVGSATSGDSPSPAAPRQPTVETRTVVETTRIPFSERTVKDSSMAKGIRKVRTRGVPGVKTLTYQVTVTDGVQTGRKLVSEVVTKAPVTQVTAVGTKAEPQCDPNYSGACVPIASDVDCAGGGGNGPAYVSGPVKVIGTDIYRLDSDHDGYGCDD